MSAPVVARTAVGACAVLLGGAALVGLPAHSATSSREVDLRFESAALLSSSGNLSVTVDVARHNSGSIDDVTGSDGRTAVDLPRFQLGDAPLAAITVVDETGADDLSPGDANFRFGADFRLDDRSEGASHDNGNNLVQRGLFGAAMQYKLQVDGNRPSCRLEGSGGAVTVVSSHVVLSEAWYQATCARRGHDVVLRVVRLSDRTTWTDSASGWMGTLEAPSRSTALSIGGKVNDRGAIVSHDSDQFNGTVDNAFYNVF